MPKKLQKSLQDYLSKIKNANSDGQFTSKNWILSGCKHPKTLSFAIYRNQDHEENKKDCAATLSDIDRFLFENFKSLYNGKYEDHEADGFMFESPRLGDPPPISPCGTHRFFAAPSLSSSLIEEARLSLTDSTSKDVASTSKSTKTINNSSTSSNNTKNDNDDDDQGVALPNDSIAVVMYSPRPYDDFYQSMQEMVEARVAQNGKVDWEFLEEILFCYLNLNEKKSRKFILSAFVDLVGDLRLPGTSRHSQRTKLRKVHVA